MLNIREIIHFIKALVLIMLLFLSSLSFSQTDTIITVQDTLVTADSLSIVTPKKEKLDAQVAYLAEDSMRFDVKGKKLYLYGKAQVTYKNIKLNAAYIELDLQNNTLFAQGVKDSAGVETGTPVFEENGQSFTSKVMLYNFETKKGLIQDVITQEGEGYIHGEKVKKLENDHLYIKKGKYTTCNLPHPHFYIHASKLKVIPDDKIITGPAYLVVEEVPTPLAVPFGFFPNKKGRSSGILMPQYGENNLGFYLIDGGYYLGLGQHFDLALRGDIYSLGSWGVKAATNYKKRYKYGGLFDARYNKIKTGEEELLNKVTQETFRVQWRHQQDPKARPGTSFSAHVNAGTSNYDRLNSPGTTNFLDNQMQSSINYTKAFANKPFVLTLSARHSQNTNDSSVVINLPEAVFTMNRIYPLKRKNPVGAKKWYEDIGISYTGNLKNEIATKEYLLLEKESINRLRNGVIHSVPVSTSLKVLKYFSLAPNFMVTERWYLQTREQFYDTKAERLHVDTIQGFKRIAEWRFNTPLTTKLYGMYQFRGEKIQAIRHVLTPTIGFSYHPDFGTENREYTDPSGVIRKYSIFDNSIIGKPAPGEQGAVNLSLVNNIEMKVRSRKDSANPIKKVPIFEALNFNSSYNFLADSMHLAPVVIDGRTRLFNNFNLNFAGEVSPYAFDDSTKQLTSQYEWDKSGKIGRFTRGNLALTFGLRSKKKAETTTTAPQEEVERVLANPDAYVDFNVPWSLNVSYSIFYQRPADSVMLTQGLIFDGDLNLTPKWKIGFRSGYDVKKGEFTATEINVYRDLHCWEMRFDWVPFGFNKSYNIQINVKSSVLQDLKLSRRRPINDFQW